jgi:TPR repeat protein
VSVVVLRHRLTIALLTIAQFAALAGLSAGSANPARAAPAGECRATLRPLLLQQNPDQQKLRSSRELCEREAEAGDAEATYQLALFDLGLESWDPDVAIPLILTAAGRGIPEAQYWLAWQYDSGPLLPNNPALAVQWYRAAADQEHPLALQRLGEAYAVGDLGLSVDAKKASELKAEAARCAQKSG